MIFLEFYYFKILYSREKVKDFLQNINTNRKLSQEQLKLMIIHPYISSNP